MAAQEVVDLVAEKGAAFKGLWPAVRESTPLANLQVGNPVRKLPHANTAPVIFIGDSCHSMTPYTGSRIACASMLNFVNSRTSTIHAAWHDWLSDNEHQWVSDK